jgi:hypothetical protein
LAISARAPVPSDESFAQVARFAGVGATIPLGEEREMSDQSPSTTMDASAPAVSDEYSLTVGAFLDLTGIPAAVGRGRHHGYHHQKHEW